MDLKALVTQIYSESGIGTVFAGSRCQKDDSQVDGYGRYVDPACRDVTPDFFHLAMTNMIGKQQKSFILDVSGGSEVWNQPIHSYQVIQKQEVSAADAAMLVSNYQTDSYAEFNSKAVGFVYYQMQYNYVSEGSDLVPIGGPDRIEAYLQSKALEYILELDKSGNIIGGEWVNDSKTDHPDFMWVPLSRPKKDVVVAGIRYDVVKQLLLESVKCKQESRPLVTEDFV